MSLHKISEKTNRSRNVVRSFLRNPDGYNVAKRTGRPPIISPATKQLIVLEAEKGKNSTQIANDLDLSVSTRHVRRILQCSKLN